MGVVDEDPLDGGSKLLDGGSRVLLSPYPDICTD